MTPNVRNHFRSPPPHLSISVSTFYQQRDKLLVHLTFHLQIQLTEKCLRMVSSMHEIILIYIFRLKISASYFTHYKNFGSYSCTVATVSPLISTTSLHNTRNKSEHTVKSISLSMLIAQACIKPQLETKKEKGICWSVLNSCDKQQDLAQSYGKLTENRWLKLFYFNLIEGFQLFYVYFVI